MTLTISFSEQITICDRDAPCEANYEITRILGTRKGYKSAWKTRMASANGLSPCTATRRKLSANIANDSAYGKIPQDIFSIEWLTDDEVTDGDHGRKKKTLTDEPSPKTALINRFKKDMRWASLSSELGKEFCVPADNKPKKAAPKKRAPVARKKRAAPRPRASAASRKGNVSVFGQRRIA